MFLKTITYEDFDGNERVETFAFNLSADEVVQLRSTFGNDMSSYLQSVVANGAENPGKVLTAFREIIGLAIGVKSEDGRRFIKTPEIRDEFMESAAYSELFMSLFTDETACLEFVRGILPAGLRKKLDENPEVNTLLADNTAVALRPKRIEEYTPQELSEMPVEEFELMIHNHRNKTLPTPVVQEAFRRRSSR